MWGRVSERLPATHNPTMESCNPGHVRAPRPSQSLKLTQEAAGRWLDGITPGGELTLSPSLFWDLRSYSKASFSNLASAHCPGAQQHWDRGVQEKGVVTAGTAAWAGSTPIARAEKWAMCRLQLPVPGSKYHWDLRLGHKWSMSCCWDLVMIWAGTPATRAGVQARHTLTLPGMWGEPHQN